MWLHCLCSDLTLGVLYGLYNINFLLTLLCCSDHINKRQSGRSRSSCGKSWYHLKWMDGILLVLWVNAQYSALCQRQVACKFLKAYLRSLGKVKILQCSVKRCHCYESYHWIDCVPDSNSAIKSIYKKCTCDCYFKLTEKWSCLTSQYIKAILVHISFYLNKLIVCEIYPLIRWCV